MASFIAAGTVATGDFQAVLQPGLPVGVVPGDFLLTMHYARAQAGTASISTGWTLGNLEDVAANPFWFALWYKQYATGDVAPSITPANFVDNSNIHAACVLGFRDISSVTPFGAIGVYAQNATAANIGPIPAAVPVHREGVAICFGARNGTPGTGIATLTADNVTWIEAFEAFFSDVVGISVACDYAIWTGGAPVLTDKTFVVTGGANGPGGGKMYTLNGIQAPDGNFASSHSSEDQLRHSVRHHRQGRPWWHRQAAAAPARAPQAIRRRKFK